jgi:hypothetical protein
MAGVFKGEACGMSSDNLELLAVENKPNEDVVRMLSELLEDAKKGRLIEFVLCGRYEAGSTVDAHAGGKDDPYRMIGAMYSALAQYEKAQIERGLYGGEDG